ncbi:DUF3085 domain-containing protein, partial [Xanthomonas citri]|uniref:DUF3085 domain-containing protein n=1 Tax=Xanthomonas citri TaxID=346 RepID=UPI001F4442AA
GSWCLRVRWQSPACGPVTQNLGHAPDTDPFDNWWELARDELGGDDFAEYFDPKDGVFNRMLHSADDLILSATATHLSLEVVPSA